MTRPPGHLARLRAGLTAAGRRPLVQSGAGFGALVAGEMALGLISAVLLARGLGAEGLGVYALAMAVAVLAGLPVEFGLPSLVMREVAHASADAQAGTAKGVIVFAMTVIGAASAVVVPVVTVAAASPFGGLGGEVRAILPVAALLIPVNGFGRVLGAALAGRERVALGALPHRLVRPGTFVLALALALLVEPGWLTPTRAMALQVTASALALGVAALLFLGHFRATLRHGRAVVFWRTWLAAALRLGLSKGLMRAHPEVLLLLTGALSSFENVGLLRVAQRGASLVATGMAIAVMPAAPRLARLHSEGAKARLQRLIAAVARATFAISLVGLGGFALGGHWLLVTAFGPGFAAATDALLILCLGHVVRTLFGPVDTVMNVLRREGATVRGFAGSLALSTAVAAALLPFMGANGAALGMLAGTTLISIYLRARVRRDFAIDPAPFAGLHRPVAGGGGA